jgi:hypothetical protein
MSPADPGGNTGEESGQIRVGVNGASCQPRKPQQRRGMASLAAVVLPTRRDPQEDRLWEMRVEFVGEMG